jgi:hypothetical protein
LGSCEARGTSRRTPPVTGSRDGSLDVCGVAGTEVADFEEDEEIDALGAARRRNGVDCAAVFGVNESCGKLCGRAYLGAREALLIAIETSSCLLLLESEKSEERRRQQGGESRCMLKWMLKWMVKWMMLPSLFARSPPTELL